MSSKFKSFIELRNYFSRAWLRYRFRKRSWINARGGIPSLIAYRLMQPFKPVIDKISSYQQSLEKNKQNDAFKKEETYQNDDLNSENIYQNESQENLILKEEQSRFQTQNHTNDLLKDNDDDDDDNDFIMNEKGKESRTQSSKKNMTANPKGGSKTLYQLLFGNLKDRIFNNWVILLSTLLTFGGASDKNKIQVFHDGYEYFQEFWKAIDSATVRVFVETYTLEPDETGFKTLEKLEEAAKRRCKVMLIIDGFGSSNMKEEHFKGLKEAGGKVFWFNPPSLLRYIPSWARDHRKLAIVDNNIGFCGGMNIADKYSRKLLVEEDFKGKTEREEFLLRRNNFRDTHAKLVGPCVNDLLNMFYEMYEEVNENTKYKFKPREWFRDSAIRKVWNWNKEEPKKGDYSLHHHNHHHHHHQSGVTPSMEQRFSGTLSGVKDDCVEQQQQQQQQQHHHGEQEDLEEDEALNSSEIEDGIFLQVISSYPRRGRRNIHSAAAMAVSESRYKCYLCSPYFFPPRIMANALFNAKRQGSDVRIITAGMTDVPLVRYAYMQLYGKFLKKGIRIYEYNEQTLHAKYLFIDGFLSSGGSYNMDRVSYYTNLEMGWFALDVKLAESFEKQFQTDLKYCKEITYEDWLQTPFYVKWFGSFLLLLMKLFGP